MKTTYVLAVSRQALPGMAKRLERRTGARWKLITRKEQLTPALLERLQPRRVFFPHWSYIIPEAIYGRFECIIFHMTDLPFGRGGSPLQNLLVRGIKRTKISALRCGPILDGGPIYLKKPLALGGTADEIYRRAAGIVEKMILEIVRRSPSPRPQRGRATVFRRRTPGQSNLEAVPSLPAAYDFIRMLDAEGYPKAFLETESLRLEFEKARWVGKTLKADVCIGRKK